MKQEPTPSHKTPPGATGGPLEAPLENERGSAEAHGRFSPELAEKIALLARNLGSRPEELVDPVLENWIRKVHQTGRL